MSETGGSFPAPQLGPRDEGYHPRSPQETQQPAESPQATPTAAETPRPRGLRDRLASMGRRVADTLSAAPEPRLLPGEVNTQAVAQRMILSRDDRTNLGFSEGLEMSWVGYPREPRPDTPEHQQWLEANQGVRKANIDLLSAGIIEQGFLKTPSGEQIIAYRVKDPAKLAQIADPKPVMQAHPANK